jgi:hypothetical protein
MSADTQASGIARMLYRPVGTLSGVVAHVVADGVFKWVWRQTRAGAVGGAPVALQSEYRLRDVLVAATLRGAIAGGVKAALTRGGARLFQRWTGEWPGD